MAPLAGNTTKACPSAAASSLHTLLDPQKSIIISKKLNTMILASSTIIFLGTTPKNNLTKSKMPKGLPSFYRPKTKIGAKKITDTRWVVPPTKNLVSLSSTPKEKAILRFLSFSQAFSRPETLVVKQLILLKKLLLRRIPMSLWQATNHRKHFLHFFEISLNLQVGSSNQKKGNCVDRILSSSRN